LAKIDMPCSFRIHKLNNRKHLDDTIKFYIDITFSVSISVTVGYPLQF